MDYYYKIIIEPQEEGGYTAYVPKLPGCVSEGETYDETVSNIKEAIELYLETLKEKEKSIITDDTHISEICVSL
ncbi:MAG TPA: type II toxin-antitoxin system HicB family antitoxin [Spirochaetota bacterium]|nr:type II toxin-antitoxin system HicB family antitoxin [Spirochaetota bacterium]